MRSGDESIHHLVADIVAVNIDMLHAFVKCRVFGDEDGCLFVKIHGH